MSPVATPVRPCRRQRWKIVRLAAFPLLLSLLAVAGGLRAQTPADTPPPPPEQATAPATAQEDATAADPSPDAKDAKDAKDGKEAKEKEEKASDDAEPGDKLKVYEQIDVTGRASDLVGIADSATEGVTGQVDLAKRPILRPAELLETVPGVIITQHSGSGKANQYFARGFNLDHGTDFRVTVDGINVNMPSHGHGQGYSDLNFVIPELVEDVQYRKGPYSVMDGDFSAAGAVDLEYVTSLDRSLLTLTPGTEGYGRALVADSKKLAGGELLGGIELVHNDGPWDLPEDYRKYNGVVRFNRGDVVNGMTVSAMGYSGRWDSTDQIPRRAVDEGLIGRFGDVDSSDGGNTSRFSLAGDFRRGQADSLTRFRVYSLRYDLDLYSNFTYFLDDPVHGDQFHQSDSRTVTGAAASHEWVAQVMGREVETAVGLQVRYDDIDNGLFRTERRELLSTTRKDHIEQLGGGPYVEARVRWTPWLRTITGLRGDFYRADVDSNLSPNSGTIERQIASPKIAILFGPWNQTELYVNAAYGFHSNDARGATITVDPTTGEPVQRVEPLVRAKSLDLGLRTQVIPHLQTSISLFDLDLASELVFSGDAGSTEASRPTRRRGFELANFYQLSPRVAIDADLAYSRGRFSDFDPVGDHIPGAIEGVVSAGVSLQDFGRFSGGMRVRYFGPRPLIEDNSARSRASTLVNGRIGYRLQAGLDLSLDVFNLFDARVSDVDYFYASRLPGEPAGGVEDVHFHPAESRSARLSAAWRF